MSIELVGRFDVNVGLMAKEFCKYLELVGFWKEKEAEMDVNIEYGVDDVYYGGLMTSVIHVDVKANNPNDISIDDFREDVEQIRDEIEDEWDFYRGVWAVFHSNEKLSEAIKSIVGGDDYW